MGSLRQWKAPRRRVFSPGGLRYTGWWIRQAIVRELAGLTAEPHIPVKKVEQILRCVKAFRRFREGYGRDPSEEELAKELDMSVEQLRAELPPISDLIPAEELETQPTGPIPKIPKNGRSLRELIPPGTGWTCCRAGAAGPWRRPSVCSPNRQSLDALAGQLGNSRERCGSCCISHPQAPAVQAPG